MQRRIQCLALASVACIGTAMLMAAQPVDSKPSKAEVDAYIKLHQDILDCLRESFQQPHPYIDATSLGSDEAKFNWTQLEKNHLRHAILRSPWDGQHKAKYLIVLNLNQEALPVVTGVNSDTMESTVILKHYFRPLEKLGLANPSSPMASVSATQYSAGEWVPKERFTSPQNTDSPAWVEGEVFYARKDGQVVIRVTIGGRFVPKKGN